MAGANRDAPVQNACKIGTQNAHLDCDRGGRPEVHMANRIGGVHMGFGAYCVSSRCPGAAAGTANPVVCDQRTRPNSISAVLSV